MIEIALALLVVGGGCFLARVVIGPSLADRIVALDGVVVTIVAATFLHAIRDDSSRFLDLALAVGFVGFVGATAAARFIERKGG